MGEHTTDIRHETAARPGGKWASYWATSEAELEALPHGSLVVADGEVYRRVARRLNGDTFTCPDDTDPDGEPYTYPSSTVLRQHFRHGAPAARVVYRPPS